MTERERLVNLIDNCTKFYGGNFVGIGQIDYGELADYLLENGIIVPPCKVGDVVYRVCKKRYDVDGYGMQWEEDWGIVTNRFHFGMLHDIGKTVFLTREEAERVLAEKKGEK